MSGGTSREVQDDLAFFGAPQEAIAAQEVQDFEIYPENMAVVQLFCRLQTQWRYRPSGVRAGLIYESIDCAARLSGLEDFTPQMFADIQLMEVTVIKQDSENASW